MKKNYIEEYHHDAELGERVSKVIKEFSNEQETISIEELESWVEMDNMRRRAKRKRVLSVAACFFLICGFSLSMRYYVNMDDPIAVAGGDDVKVSTEENVGGNEEIHTTWEAVLEASEKYPDMLVPGYIPDGYEFKELRVTDTNIGEMYVFSYSTLEGNEIQINQKNNIESAAVTGFDEKIQGKSGSVYLLYEDDLTTATSVLSKIRVGIICVEPKEELIKIMNSFKSGS